MRIAFVVSADRTAFFHAVALKLAARGFEVNWISPSKQWSAWLQHHGVRKETCIDIPDFAPSWAEANWPIERPLAALGKLESQGGKAINDLILMDRLLCRKPYEYAIRFLAVCAEKIAEFLTEKEITVVLGEQTWAIELITIMICRELGIKYYEPTTVRVPSERFTLFEYFSNSHLPLSRTPDASNLEVATDFIAEYRAKTPKPDYLLKHPGSPKIRWDWPVKAIKHMLAWSQERYNETNFPVSRLMRDRVTEVWNTRRVLKSSVVKTNPFPAKRPYVFFALQVQPECSVDVYSSKLSNQLETIKSLARAIPVGHELWVKEHPSGLGLRSVNFFRKLKGIPSVHIVSPFIDSVDYILNSELVITLTGTAAFEAGLLGQKAMTLVPMFFGDVLIRNGFNPYDELASSQMRSILGSEKPPTEEVIRAFMAKLFANSFPGVIGDPKNVPWGMNESNIEAVAIGMEALLEGKSEKSGPDSTQDQKLLSRNPLPPDSAG